MLKRTIALAALLISHNAPVAAQEVSLAQCQQWQDKIDKYTELRREGGSSSQMDSWRKKRREYNDKFYKADCRKYGGKIR